MRTTTSLLLLTLLFAGCTNTSEFYSPKVPRSERLLISSCADQFTVFRKEITQGIVIEATPHFVIFRVADGSSFQLQGERIEVWDANKSVVQVRPITNISTGIFPMPQESDRYGIQPKLFAANELITGTGRYRAIEMKWGEWSRWKGKDDVFTLDYDFISPLTEPSLFLALPEFIANGRAIELEPIEFVLRTKRKLMCLQ